MADPWYPDPAHYYVQSSEAGEYPLRQGDLIGPVSGPNFSAGLAQIVHPTIELNKKSVELVQVCMVEPLSVLADDFQRGLVVAGQRERDGRMLIAAANTFFLAALQLGGDAMFADFRRLHLVSQDEVRLDKWLAALTHDCRVHFIRRWVYFRFRILLALQQVRELESQRKGNDPAFEGPRSNWAQP